MTYIIIGILLAVPTVCYYLLEKDCSYTKNCHYSDIRCLTKKGRFQYNLKFYHEYSGSKKVLLKEILFCWVTAPFNLLMTLTLRR